MVIWLNPVLLLRSGMMDGPIFTVRPGRATDIQRSNIIVRLINQIAQPTHLESALCFMSIYFKAN